MSNNRQDAPPPASRSRLDELEAQYLELLRLRAEIKLLKAELLHRINMTRRRKLN